MHKQDLITAQAGNILGQSHYAIKSRDQKISGMIHKVEALAANNAAVKRQIEEPLRKLVANIQWLRDRQNTTAANAQIAEPDEDHISDELPGEE